MKLPTPNDLCFPDHGLRHESDRRLARRDACPPATRHQRIVWNLLHSNDSHLKSHSIGVVFCALFECVFFLVRIVVLDLILTCSSEFARFLTSKNGKGPADLAHRSNFMD